jgi:hypothetical protein
MSRCVLSVKCGYGLIKIKTNTMCSRLVVGKKRFELFMLLVGEFFGPFAILGGYVHSSFFKLLCSPLCFI